MPKQYKVEVLLSYDKNYEDNESLTFTVYQEEEEKAMSEAMEKAKVWVNPGVYHTLEIKSINEVKNA